MIESISQNPWLSIIGILSGVIIIKNFWADVFIPIAKHLGIEINSRHHKELEAFKQVYKEEINLFKSEIKEDLTEIKFRLNDMEDMREEQKELLHLLLEGVTASLSSLKEMGANGFVTTTLKNLEKYKNERAVS